MSSRCPDMPTEFPILIESIQMERKYEYNDLLGSDVQSFPIRPEQIWNEFNSIPTTPPPSLVSDGQTLGVIRLRKDVPLSMLPGDDCKFTNSINSFGRVISSNSAYDNYQVILKQNDGSLVPYNPSVWVINTLNNYIEFPYGVPPTLTSQPFLLTYYEYIGTLGGLGAAGSGTVTQGTNIGTEPDGSIIVEPNLGVAELKFKGIQSGSGINISSDTDNVIINAINQGTVKSVTNRVGYIGVPLVNPGIFPQFSNNPDIKGIASGSSGTISVTPGPSDIFLDLSSQSPNTALVSDGGGFPTSLNAVSSLDVATLSSASTLTVGKLISVGPGPVLQSSSISESKASALEVLTGPNALQTNSLGEMVEVSNGVGYFRNNGAGVIDWDNNVITDSTLSFTNKLDKPISGSGGISVRTGAGNTTIDRIILNPTNNGISVSNGDGIAGNIGVNLDVNDLSATSTIDQANDYVAIHDSSAGGTRKITLSDLLQPVIGGLDNIGTYNANTGLTSTGTQLLDGLPPTNGGTPCTSGEFFVVTSTGTQPFVNGGSIINQGNILLCDASKGSWVSIDQNLIASNVSINTIGTLIGPSVQSALEGIDSVVGSNLLTPDRALISNSVGKIEVSPVVLANDLSMLESISNVLADGDIVGVGASSNSSGLKLINSGVTISELSPLSGSSLLNDNVVITNSTGKLTTPATGGNGVLRKTAAGVYKWDSTVPANSTFVTGVNNTNSNVAISAQHQMVVKSLYDSTPIVRQLKAGNYISLTAGVDDITINANGLGEVNTGSNVGSGNGLFSTKVGTDLRFKSIIGGTGVTISQSVNDITINSDNNGTLTSVTNANVTGQELVMNAPSTVEAVIKRLTSSGVITLSNNGSDINIGSNIGDILDNIKNTTVSAESLLTLNSSDIITPVPISTYGKTLLDSTLLDLRSSILETNGEAIQLSNNQINMYTSGTTASNLRIQITDTNTFVKNILDTQVVKSSIIRSSLGDNSMVIQSNDGNTNIRFVPQNDTISYLQNNGILAFTKIGEGNAIFAVNHTDNTVYTNAEFNINVTASDNAFCLYKCPGGEQVSLYSHSGLSEGFLIQKSSFDDGVKLNMYHNTGYRPIYLNSANNGKLVIGTENIQFDAEKFVVVSSSRFKNGLTSDADLNIEGTSKLNFSSSNNYLQNDDTNNNLNLHLANDKNFVADTSNDQSYYLFQIGGNSVLYMKRDLTTNPLAPVNKTQISSQILTVKDDAISGGYIEIERTGVSGTLSGYINYFNTTGRLFYTGFNDGTIGNPLHYFEDQCKSYSFKNSLGSIMKIVSHEGTIGANSNYVEVGNRLECPNIKLNGPNNSGALYCRGDQDLLNTNSDTVCLNYNLSVDKTTNVESVILLGEKTAQIQMNQFATQFQRSSAVGVLPSTVLEINDENVAVFKRFVPNITDTNDLGADDGPGNLIKRFRNCYLNQNLDIAGTSARCILTDSSIADDTVRTNSVCGNTIVGVKSQTSDTGVGFLRLAAGIETTAQINETYIDLYGKNSTGTFQQIKTVVNNSEVLTLQDNQAQVHQNMISRTIYPEADITYDLGITGSNEWRNVYTDNLYVNGQQVTSDRRIKDNIIDLPNDKGLEFIQKLRPVQYTYIKSTQKRKHWGFIAQEIREVVGSDNYSIWGEQKTQNMFGFKKQHISPSDFLGPIVKGIQELSEKNKELENKVDDLTSLNDALEIRMSKMENEIIRLSQLIYSSL